MSDNLIQPTFAAGELSPKLYARVDLAKYHTGAALMRNFFVDYKGGASTRPGTQFIGVPQNAGFPPYSTRLRRFVFSGTQQYVLVFTDHSLQFIRNPLTNAYPNSSNSGFILSGGVPYSIATPYAWQDLQLLKFAQSADIMQITHQAYPRMILSRFSDTNWTLTEPVTGSSISPPVGPTLRITAPPSGSTDPLKTTYLYTVTSVSTNGEESVTGGQSYITGLDMTNTPGSVSLTWPPVAGAAYYNVYKTIPGQGDFAPSHGQQFGFIGFTYGASFTDSNIIPDFTKGPPAHNDPFSPSQIVSYNISNVGSGYLPTGTGINSPPPAQLYPIFSSYDITMTASIVGLYIANPGDSVTNGANVTATGVGAGFFATVNTGPSNQNPAVSAYFQQRLMLASTPTNPVTIWGSKSGYYNNFDKSNPTVDSDSITFTLAVQEVNAIEWMVPTPGGLLMFTDSSIQQLSGGSATALNPVAVTPATAAVMPISNFGANIFCEPIRIVYEFLYVQSEGTVVRELTYNPFWGIVTSGADISILSSHLFYPLQIIDWAYQDVPFKCIWAVRSDGVLLSCTYLKEQEIIGWAHHDTQGGTFESVCVIREGATDAVYFAVRRGTNVQIERLAERIYLGGTPSAWCLDGALSYQGPPVVSTVSGLPFPDGTVVKALVDGVPQGPFTVLAGTVNLTTPGTNIVVGLSFSAQLQTLYLDVGADGRIQGKRKKIAAMSTRVVDTAGALKVGTTFDTLQPFRPGISSTDNPVALPPAPYGFTVGDMRMLMDPAYQVVGCVCIQQDDPLPATILGVIPEVVVGDS